MVMPLKMNRMVRAFLDASKRAFSSSLTFSLLSSFVLAFVMVFVSALGLASRALAAETDASTGVQATYTVPVPPELEPFAKFPIIAKLGTTRLGDGPQTETTRLTYLLPDLLVGEAHEVTLDHQLDGRWSSELAEGSCAPEQAKVVCTVRHNRLDVRMETVRELIKSRFSDPAEAAARIAVAERFSTEPIGIIEYATPTDYGPTPIDGMRIGLK